MKKPLVLFFLILVMVSAVVVSAHTNGQKEIILDGGKKGDILFPHYVHHQVVNDCMVCHSDFPKTAGALNEAKTAGKLKKKQVMNKTCLKCHRTAKKAGEKYGPVSCSGCHKK